MAHQLHANEEESAAVIGRMLRFPLRLIPDDAVLPILSGPLRGKKWIVGSARRAYWLGIYEAHFQRLVAKEVKPNSVFYDIGANVGFYSLLASNLVKFGKVFSFEPVPRNIVYIKRHMALNNVSNVEIHNLAISDCNGQDTFKEEEDCGTGHLGDGGLSVQTATIDSLVYERKIPPPDYIKMDIEGAELKALTGGKNCLLNYKPTLFLATHAHEIHEQCFRLLTCWGFTFQPITTMSDGRADVLAKPLSTSSQNSLLDATIQVH